MWVQFTYLIDTCRHGIFRRNLFPANPIYAAFSAVLLYSFSRCDGTVQAFAELRYGVVAHTLENSMKYGHNLGHTPYEKPKSTETT